MIDEELSLLALYLEEQESDDEWPPRAEDGSSSWDGAYDDDDWEPPEPDDAELEVETEQDGW